MALALVATTSKTGSTTTVTTDPIDTTGATALVVVGGFAITPPTIEDSFDNVWILQPAFNGSPQARERVYVAAAPVIVGPGHTFLNFTFAPSICVAAFSGIVIDPTVTAGNGATASGTNTIGSGLVTPQAIGVLLIGAFATNNNSGVGDASVSAEVTKIANAPAVAGHNVGCALAWGVAPSVAPLAIQWTQPGNSSVSGSLHALSATITAPPVEYGDIFTLPDIQRGLIGPLLKIRIYHPFLEDEYVGSTQWIQDPITYWGGFAEASLLRVDDIVYATSDRGGPPQITALSFEMSDVADGDIQSPRLRTWLGRVGLRALRRCEIWVQMITDQARRALLDPVTVFRGYIEEYEALDSFRMSCRCLCWINRVKDRAVLPTLIGDVFPTSIAGVRERRIPLALGILSDEGSAAGRPVFVPDDAAHPGSYAGAMSPQAFNPYDSPINAFGYKVGAPPAPLGLSIDQIVGVGGILQTVGPDGLAPGSGWHDLWAVQVTRVRAGVESDPCPFNPGDTWLELDEDDSAIDAVCDDDGEPGDLYRFYLGTTPVGGGRPRFEYYMETATPAVGVRFLDKHGDEPGSVITANQMYWCSAVWVYDDGRTQPAHINAGGIPLPFIMAPGYRRPVRFTFEPPGVGCSHGEIYLADYPNYTHASIRFPINLDDVNDDGNVFWEWDMYEAGEAIAGMPSPGGIVPPIYLGPGVVVDNGGFTGWHAFLISGRPCAEVVAAYVDNVRVDEGHYSTTVAAPGKGNWAAFFGPELYVEVAGHRLCMIFVRGPLAETILGLSGSAAVEFRVNVKGLETNGDGTGTVITSGYEQLPILLRQLMLPTVPSLLQPFDQDPQFSDGTSKVNDASFVDAALDALDAVPLGPSASRWIASDITVQNLLAEWAVSMRARTFTDEDGQVGACVTNPDGAGVYDVDEAEEVIDRSFGFRDSVQGYGQIVPYTFNPRYDVTGGETMLDADEVRSESAILEMGEEISLPNHALSWRRGRGASRLVATSILRESERLPRTVSIDSALHLLTAAPLGRRITITHSEGAAAGGWRRRLVQVLGKRLHPTGFTVALTCLDLGREYGELTWKQYEAFMATTWVGGSRHDSCVVEGAAIVPINRILFDIDWDAIPGTHGQRVRLDASVEAGSMIPGVYEYPDTIAGTPVVLGAAVSLSTLASQELIIPRPDDGGRVRYWVLPNPTGCTADQIKIFAVLEGYEIEAATVLASRASYPRRGAA